MTVVNREIHIGKVRVVRVGASSLVLFGDTEVITSSTIYDTPADSLIFSPHVPLNHASEKTEGSLE